MSVSIDRKLFKSLAILGYNFGLHILRALIPRSKKDQARTFLDYFREDSIKPLFTEEDELLFNFERCVNCGICSAHCRVSQLSGGMFLGPEHIAVCASRSQPEFFADSDSIFRCAVCGQCEPACPEDVPISRIAMHIRSMIRRTRPEALPKAYGKAIENLEEFGNIYGEEKVKEWPRNPDAEYILFLGCRERQDPERARMLFDLMEKLGLSVTGIEEVCCGGLPEVMGLEYQSVLSERLIEAGPKKLIAVCPLCAEKLRASPELAGKIELKHIIEILLEKMPVDLGAQEIPGPVAFHDPCHLGRGCNIMEEPRQVLSRLGLQVVEMNEQGLEAPCCGAGGGLELVDPDLAQEVARARIADAQAAGARMLATECLVCYNNLQSAISAEDDLKVVLITNLAAQIINSKKQGKGNKNE
jgi:Fe-S oxidoreductase